MFKRQLFLVLWWSFSFQGLEYAQSFPSSQGAIQTTLIRMDTQHYPTIKIWLRLERKDKKPIEGLLTSKMQLEENGIFIPSQIQRLFSPQRMSILVLDQSASMENLTSDNQESRMQAALESAKRFYQLMESGDRSGLISFSDRVYVRQLLTQDTQKLIETLSLIQPKGGTAFYQALWDAIEEIRWENGNKIILALTDGKNTELGPPLEKIIEQAKKYQIRLFLIGFGSETEIETSLLEYIANETGGLAFQTTQKKQLEALYESIALSLRQEYLFTYTSTLPEDGQKRTLRLTFPLVDQQMMIEMEYLLGGLVPKFRNESFQTSSQQLPRSLIFLQISFILFFAGILPKIYVYFRTKVRRWRFRRFARVLLRSDSPYLHQVCANEQDEDTSFQLGERIIICPECRALHHQDCWVYNGYRCFNSPPCRGRGGM